MSLCFSQQGYPIIIGENMNEKNVLSVQLLMDGENIVLNQNENKNYELDSIVVNKIESKFLKIDLIVKKNKKYRFFVEKEHLLMCGDLFLDLQKGKYCRKSFNYYYRVCGSYGVSSSMGEIIKID